MSKEKEMKVNNMNEETTEEPVDVVDEEGNPVEEPKKSVDVKAIAKMAGGFALCAITGVLGFCLGITVKSGDSSDVTADTTQTTTE